MAIIHARPFDDPRNTVSVDNSDPKAGNKLYAGIPGSHLEQRCCGGKLPERLPQMTGWYVDGSGTRVCEIVEYWARPENRDGARDGWWNAETPPGLSVEMANTGVLMCSGCNQDDLWEQFVEDLERTLDELLPVVEGISIAASYFPVVGTAVSFVLSSAVALAKGASLDEAALDAIGNALPGQPVSGAAYRVARSILRDGTVDEVALSALPVDEDVRRAIGSSLRIAVAVANGHEFTDAVVAEVYAALPETGRRGVDVARRIIAGEDIVEFVVSEVTREAAELARQQGKAAVNRFLAESGFQSAVETMDPVIQAALRTGVGVGHTEAQRGFVGQFDFTEKQVPRNDTLAVKGAQIVASGVTWRGRRLADIRAGTRFSFTRKEPDPLTHIEMMRTTVHRIDDQWRRGFDVALGLCDGLREDSDAQRSVLLDLGGISTQQGFVAGQYIQHTRTEGEWRAFVFKEFDQVSLEPAVVQAHQDRTPEVTESLEQARLGGFGMQGRLGGPP